MTGERSAPRAAALATPSPGSAQAEKWHEAVEGCYCALAPLARQLPEVNHLLETSFASISELFIALANETQAHHQLAVTGGDSAALNASQQKIGALLSQAITQMQFQDRVSQNLVIAVNVAQAVMEHLETSVRGENAGAIPFDVEFAKRILALLNLGEIKHHYVHHLVERGHISGPEELGYDLRESQSAADDIDLF